MDSDKSTARTGERCRRMRNNGKNKGEICQISKYFLKTDSLTPGCKIYCIIQGEMIE